MESLSREYLYFTLLKIPPILHLLLPLLVLHVYSYSLSEVETTLPSLRYFCLERLIYETYTYFKDREAIWMHNWLYAKNRLNIIYKSY